jgi:hypothetical protein
MPSSDYAKKVPADRSHGAACSQLHNFFMAASNIALCGMKRMSSCQISTLRLYSSEPVHTCCAAASVMSHEASSTQVWVAAFTSCLHSLHKQTGIRYLILEI